MSNDQGTHYYHIVVQFPHGGGLGVFSYQGTFTPERGKTEFDVLKDVLNYWREQRPELRSGNCTYWSMKKNEVEW